MTQFMSDDNSDEDEEMVMVKPMTQKEKLKQNEERKEEYKKLLVDPEFREVFTQMWSETLQTAKEKGQLGKNEGLSLYVNDIVEITSNEKVTTPGKLNDNKFTGDKTQNINKSVNNKTIKSPSDTTLYAPALRRTGNKNKEIVDGISEFLEAIRFETTKKDGKLKDTEQSAAEEVRDKNTTQEVQSIGPASSVVPVPNQMLEQASLEEARDKAQRKIIEAEKFKTAINPPGMIVNNVVDGNEELLKLLQNVQNMQFGTDAMTSKLSDDDFFHLTCHIEDGLKQKIECGEFVDLEKLLPNDKLKRLSEEGHLEWVTCDGNMFLVPASDRETKINGIRCWDQAFHVYTTIYCGANPGRSKEIWQYVSVINTAAVSYCWDNVASYDYTFRHLMEFNPNRSWVTMYNQMWNLSMKDPLPKNVSNGKFSNNNNNGSNFQKGNGSQSSNSRNVTKRGRYCWNFNKGVPCKYGKKCRFIEKCSHCDSTEHPVLSCPKLVDKPGEKINN